MRGYRAKEMCTSPILPASPLVEAPVSQPSRGSQVRATPPLEGLPILRQYFDALFQAHGPQHWWPGRTPFEVIVGAILVPNTSWITPANAIAHLRRFSKMRS